MDRKAVLVTGCLGLLGRAICKRLAETFHVLGLDLSATPEGLDERVSYLQFDLTDIAAYDQLQAKIAKLTNNLKGLVNNAAYNPKIEGGGSGFGRFEDLDLVTWDAELRLNLTAPVFLTKVLMDVFNFQTPGRCKVVNIISTYGLVPPNHDIYRPLAEKTGQDIKKPLAYPVSKAGLAMATRYLAVYYGRQELNVNGVAPGGIENNQDPSFVEAYSRLVPMGRMARVEEIVPAIEFLCSEDADYINGQIIAVDGGWTVW